MPSTAHDDADQPVVRCAAWTEIDDRLDQPGGAVRVVGLRGGQFEALAGFERELMQERAAAARARGWHSGRPPP